jgi:alanine racemase
VSEFARATFALVNLDVVRSNVRELALRARPAALWCVVKANGYGHGAVPIAKACVEAGASGLCVALTQEAVELRNAGLVDVPVLVLSEQPPGDFGAMAEANITPTLYTLAGVEAFAQAVRLTAGTRPYGVHLKIDTGMHRVGCHPDELPSLIAAVESTGVLSVDAVFTHLARADEPAEPYTSAQLTRFGLAVEGLGYDTHAANSAAVLAHRQAHQSLVRAGIAIYGIAPGPDVAHRMTGIVPALSLHSAVSFVKCTPAGASFSYGSRVTLDRAATIATIPIGYADGVPRRLGLNDGSVLIGGKRRRILGVITMDQLIVDCGDDDVHIGDEVVLIGRQGDAEITATEWADRCDTIAYEIVCAFSARVPRRYV